MPTLPLDHPDPLAATLATMHYPNAAERAQRQVLINHLMPLVEGRSSISIAYDQVMDRTLIVAGSDLPDLEERIFGATATGQVVKAFLVLSWNDGTIASWTKAYATANEVAGPTAKRCISASYLKMQRARFESVAHLCAALCLRDLIFKPEPLVGYDLDADFHSFLAEAEWVRRWGLTWKRPASKAVTPFAGVEMWEPPIYWSPLFRRKGWPLTGGMADLALAPELVSRLRPPGRPQTNADVKRT